MKRQYISAMFDIDGTLTEMGSQEIPLPLAQKLADLSLKMPLAFATGRNLNHLEGKLDQIISRSKDPERSRLNWYITCENGAAGFFYNPKTKTYEEFYRINWDENLIDRKELEKHLLDDIGHLIDSMEMRTTQFLIRPPREQPFNPEKRAKLTAKITRIAEKTLAKFPHADHFEVLDSQIAVHISPKNANKDQGIKQFAQYLKKTRNLDPGPQARNILVIGDQAAPGFNDYALLKGDFGTPFSVDSLNPDSQWPLPVLRGDKVMKGPEGTLFLIEKTLFLT